MTIPAHTKAALDLYVNQKIPPGGFLMAVLSNDLFGAVSRADSQNLAALRDIVHYVYNELPADCWGNKEKIWDWLRGEFYNRIPG